MCKGVWRKDVDASMLAILDTFENATSQFKRSNPDFRFTLIVIMGKPCDSDNDENDGIDSQYGNNSHQTCSNSGSTPRSVHKHEPYYIHTNFQLVQKLIKILRANYPERLSKALIIPNGGWEKFLGMHGLRRYIPSDRTRSKIIMLDKVEDLLGYCSKDQLISLVGGTIPAPIH